MQHSPKAVLVCAYKVRHVLAEEKFIEFCKQQMGFECVDLPAFSASELEGPDGKDPTMRVLLCRAKASQPSSSPPEASCLPPAQLLSAWL